jgi:hypothetical protein
MKTTEFQPRFLLFPLKSCSPPHRMARRAAVPPRTIFTKDVIKVTRTPPSASDFCKKIYQRGNILHKLLKTNVLKI